ncbi:MAG: diaminopimelate dehydrogenase [Clostridiales bacterium]|jgi:diaminopimelate dehydrogenase|nr:diaminopimelate dehydrogenase [Clostridiales bacterium]
MEKIKVGIAGYGNIGRGVEKAVNAAVDMELCAFFTRRDPAALQTNTPNAKILSVEDAQKMQGELDIVILCGGSATDLPKQGPAFAHLFNTIDSFDTHAKIPDYFASMQDAAKDTLSILSVGWDPGLFSIMRQLSLAALPTGNDYTFWGRGVSQGHSDAIRRIDGVEGAIQYTVPIEKAVQAVRDGKNPTLTTRQKHLRECYVAAKDGADKARIEREIKEMPNYFADYDTTVTFVSMEELKQCHSKMPHGGMVIRSGSTGENQHVMEFSLKLDSNPEFTASVLTAYARAAVRLHREGKRGAMTVLDVPLSYLTPEDPAWQRKNLL